MFENGFPPYWSTLKKLIWLVGAGIAGRVREVWKTVTGTLIHITDALASPMQKCEVTLEPIQDLNGQDAPYPAGGGKNIAPVSTWSGHSGTVSGMTLNIPANTEFTFSFVGTVDSGTYQFAIYVIYSDSSSSGWANFSPSSSRQSKTVTFAKDVVGIGYYSNTDGWSASQNVTLTITDFQIELGGTATPYAPYENICPITGWTGCEATRTGANLCGGQKFAEAFSTCNGYTIDTTNKTFTFKRSGQNVSPIKFKDNTRYTFIFTALADVRNNNIRIHYTDGTNTWVDINTTTKSKIVAVSTSGKTVSAISVAWGAYSDTATVWYDESGIFEGVLTADDFKPYSGTTLSVTFPDSAGTVYGGTHEFVSGSGDSELDSLVFDGEYGSGKAATDIIVGQYGDENYAHFIIQEKNPNIYETAQAGLIPKAKCNMFKYQFANNNGTAHWYKSTFINVFIPTSIASTLNEFIAFLANTPLQVVIPLITPTEISLTPQEISTLAGENNVWSNTNSDTTIIYKAQSS